MHSSDATMKYFSFLLLTLFVVAIQAKRDWSQIKPKYVGAKTEIPAIKPRIVGGQEAEPHEIPSMAGLVITITNPTSLEDALGFCGAAIVAENAVVTTASCVYGAKKVEVIVGAHKIKEAEPSQQVILAKEILIYDEWDPTYMRHDLAVIVLSKKIKLGDTAQVVKLNERTNNLDNMDALVAGWGAQSDNATEMSETLRYTQEKILNNRVCDAFFGFISNYQLCVNGVNGNGPCKGDFGGPLFIKPRDQVLLAGVASFGSQYGCQIGFPSVFTRISKYDHWIKKVIPKDNLPEID